VDKSLRVIRSQLFHYLWMRRYNAGIYIKYMQENPTKRPYSVELAASLISLALIIALLYVLQGVLLPLMFSILIAISLYPVAGTFERLRFGKALSALLAVILAIAVLSGLVWFIIHQV